MARNWLQRLFGFQEIIHAPEAPAPAPAPRVLPSAPSARAVAGGRVSMDSDGDTLNFGASWSLSPPQDYEDDWRMGGLDANTLDKVSPARLTQILSDLSPEVSRGLWDFQRLFNPGHTIKATRPGGKTEYPKAKKALDAFVATLNERHGVVDVLYGRFSMAAFWRGALFGELVLDENGRMPVDLVAPDPISLRFRKTKDPVLGPVWEMGQWQGGKWVPLEQPTIRYVAVDPALDSPYGRPMVSPALFTALFLLAMLHDLKRVVQQQGYPRIDIAVDLEKLAADFPEAAGDPAKFKEWAESVIADVMRAMAQLQPDDTYVHSAYIAVNRPVGAVNADSLGAVDALIKALERMATRALKTMPLMMGLDQSTNETDSNRQWEIFAAGIKSIQHYAETMLETFFELALQAQGIVADVEFRFAELRAAEELRDEQTRTMRNTNTRYEYDAGWITQEEAAQKTVGHEPALPAPRNSGGNGQPQPVQDNGDGQERNDRAYMVSILERMGAWLEKQDARAAKAIAEFERDVERAANHQNGHR